MAHLDISGQKFGKLMVLEYAYTKQKKAIWKCICDCGNITYIATGSLRSGHTLSCGCTHHKPAANRKHNMSKSSRLYNVWKELRARCNRPSHAKYCNYGARGIKVCDEWNNNFVKFYEWSLQNGYVEETLENGKNNLTIDRINNNGNYEPSNCRWITNKEQARNKRNNVKVLFNGEERILRDLAEEYNMPFNLLYDRYHTKHWSIQKALTTQRR